MCPSMGHQATRSIFPSFILTNLLFSLIVTGTSVRLSGLKVLHPITTILRVIIVYIFLYILGMVVEPQRESVDPGNKSHRHAPDAHNFT